MSILPNRHYEDRKRLLLIAASILAARKLAQFDGLRYDEAALRRSVHGQIDKHGLFAQKQPNV